MGQVGQCIRHDVTERLNAWSQGDALALDEVLPTLMTELESVAGALIKSKSRHPDFNEPLELLNRAFLKLIHHLATSWPSRGHFFAYMTKTMRCLLIDGLRREHRSKHGQGMRKTPLEHAQQIDCDAQYEALDAEAALSIHQALQNLAQIDPREAKIVYLKYFLDLTIEETAQVTGLSPRTVKRELLFARLWLKRALSESRANGPTTYTEASSA